MDEEGVSEFESGYAGSNDAAEKPQEVVEPVAEQPAEPETQEEPKIDPMQELRDLVEKQNARIRNTEGHIGGLNHNLKLMQETLAASKAAAQQVSDAPTQDQVKEAMASPTEWESLKNEFPEWTTATEKLIDSRMPKGNNVDIEALSKQIAEQIRGENAAARKEIIESSLDAVLPDWTEEVNTPEFKAWNASHTEEIQALSASDKVRDAAKLLRLYATHKSKSQTESKNTVAARQKRIEAAVTPKGTGGFTPSRSDLDEFEAGYSGR